MYGVESPTNAAGRVCAVPRQTSAPPPPKADQADSQSTADRTIGPLNSARQAIRQVLVSLGFVDFRASQQEILRMQLQHSSTQSEYEELNATEAAGLASVVAAQIVSDADQAQQAQANVRQENVTNLLA